MLLIWFVVGWWVYGGPRRRLAVVPLIALAAVPVVYSLNRGLWIGLGIACAYLFLRLGTRARVAVGSAVAAGALVFFLSPLQAMVAQRLDNPHSNDIRAFTVSATIAAARTSPLIGYGNTRNAMGNHRTITTGKTGWCPTCGHPPLGGDGQLWHLMITQGFTGAALYVAFFAGAIRRHWPDRSPIGMAGVLVMILTLLYMFVYDGLFTPLSLYLISFALLWRNSMTSREETAHGPRDAVSAVRQGREESRAPDPPAFPLRLSGGSTAGEKDERRPRTPALSRPDDRPAVPRSRRGPAVHPASPSPASPQTGPPRVVACRRKGHGPLGEAGIETYLREVLGTPSVSRCTSARPGASTASRSWRSTPPTGRSPS
ncbi:hypothetical protein ACFQX6_49615 [Streptosporangium lutulentum]